MIKGNRCQPSTSLHPLRVREKQKREQEFSFDFGAQAVAMPHGVRLRWPLKRPSLLSFNLFLSNFPMTRL